MAQNQLFKRYLDAGLQFSQMTQQRAEALVRDLVRAGEVQAEQAQTVVNELVDRSRRNTERFVEQVRAEVRNQLDVAEVVTKDAVTRLQAQVDELRSQLGKSAPTKKASAKTAPAKQVAAKKAPAKKASAKKAAKKAVNKKAAAKKKSAPTGDSAS